MQVSLLSKTPVVEKYLTKQEHREVILIRPVLNPVFGDQLQRSKRIIIDDFNRVGSNRIREETAEVENQRVYDALFVNGSSIRY